MNKVSPVSPNAPPRRRGPSLAAVGERQDAADHLASKAAGTTSTGASLPRPVVSTTLPTYKVIIIGDSGVGKSNLLSRFASDKFDLTTRSTIGVEFTSREIDVGNGDKVNVQLWDTAGQDRANAISSAFFRNAKGIAVCYDVTRKASLLNVPRWVAHAKQYCDENCQFVIVGNKLDLTNMREVTELEAEEISHILSMRHYYASAMTGEGVPTAFLQLILSVHAVALTSKVSSPVVPPTTAKPVSLGATKRRNEVDTRGFGNPDFTTEQQQAGGKKKPCCGN